MKSDNFFTQYDRYLFGTGTHYQIYEKLGAHPAEVDGRQGVYFAVWAPNAQSISVIGDFNGWNPGAHYMQHADGTDVWELFTEEAHVGSLYKYHIHAADNSYHDKADPYGFSCEVRPGTASVVCDLDGYKWHDKRWTNKQAKGSPRNKPLAIYEMHLASWKRPIGREHHNYLELAPMVIEYVKEMGYTHVELIGLCEYPFDPSWGYQVTGYYAPTSRYGSPKEFMGFVDALHQAGIGVILDWVPAHFPKDEAGLAKFDGTPLYEYADPRKGEHPDWGTLVFDYGRPEVKNFLIASAMFWAKMYHIDGLRVDAVASMLYLDFGRRDGEWLPNPDGTNDNREAVEFLKSFNSLMHDQFPGVMTIAEESTAWAGVTADLKDGGLGFTFKWNMGWMHDFLEYLQTDPMFRSHNHNKMTFSIMYAGSEHYILAISHDEVVHLKHSLIEKAPGVLEMRAATLKAAYAYLIGHPGKKLLFMGQEWGQTREWSEERELDWGMLQDDVHAGLRDYFKGLLHLYTKYPALYENDLGYPNFEWINASDSASSTFSFVRHGAPGKKSLLFVIHFTPVELPEYRAGVPGPGRYKMIFADTFVEGGSKPIKADAQEWDGKDYSIPCPLGAYGVRIFEYTEPLDKAEKAD